MSPSESPKSAAIVSLPSIHEMFPEHLLKGIPQRPHQRHGSSESTRADFSPRMRSTTTGRPPSGGGYPSYTGPMHPFTGRVPPAGSPSASHNAAHPHQSGPRHVPSTSLGQQPRSPAQRSDLHAYSVLRSDVLTQSLVDISSSTTSLPIRGVNPSVRPPHGVTSNGSSPPFPVAPSSSVPPFDYTPHRNLDRHRRSTIAGHPTRPPREIEIPRKSATPPVSYPATIIFPMASAAEAASVNDIDDASDDDNSPSESNTGKKHVCPICQKRFNRPSSLRIHLNTHTGATPFRCPWPNCGREFNVNSNMRRHYRNHATPGFSRAQPNEGRRRRRRTAPSVTHMFVEPTGPPSSGRSQNGSYVATPSITTFGTSDSEDEISDSGDTLYSRSYQDKDEEDELLDYEMEESSNYHVAASLAQSMERVAVAPERRKYSQPQAHQFAMPHSYTHAHGRGMTPGSGFQSSSSSVSPSSSPPSEHRYVPSMPYFQSMGADVRVSTALRPAFHSGRPTGQAIKSERIR